MSRSPSPLSVEILYSHKQVDHRENHTSCYQILYMNLEELGLTKETLISLYKQCSAFEMSDKEYAFDDLELLGDFSLRLCEQVRAERTLLLSVEDYNLALESVNEVSAFREIFIRFGTELKLNTKIREHTGLFKKIWG